MRIFTTPIYVPGKSKKEMSLFDTLGLTIRLNTPISLPSNLYCGGLDDIKESEEFTLVVNGECHKHEIKMRGCAKIGGKVRFMFAEPELPEVKRFAEWRLKTVNIISCKNGSYLQLRNFSACDLRRLIRHSVANKERQMVTYR